MIVPILALVAVGAAVVIGIAFHERLQQTNQATTNRETASAEQRREQHRAHVGEHGPSSFLSSYTRQNFGPELTEIRLRESKIEHEIENLQADEERFAQDAPDVTPKTVAAARALLAIAALLLAAEMLLQAEFLIGLGLRLDLAVVFAVVSAVILELVAMGYKIAKQRFDEQGQREEAQPSEESQSSTEQTPVIGRRGIFALRVFAIGIVVAAFVGAGMLSGRSRAKEAALAVDLAKTQLAFTEEEGDQQATRIAEAEVRSAERELQDQTRFAAMYGGAIPLGVVATGIGVSWARSVTRVDRVRRKKRAAKDKLAELGRDRIALNNRIIAGAATVLAELGLDPEEIHHLNDDTSNGGDDAGQNSPDPDSEASDNAGEGPDSGDDHAADQDDEGQSDGAEDVTDDEDDRLSDEDSPVEDEPRMDDNEWSEI